MLTQDKNEVLYEEIVSNKVFSDAFFNYFIKNVNNTVHQQEDMYFFAMYGTDAGSILVTIEQLRKEYPDAQKISLNFLDALFKNIFCDTRIMLDMDFNYLGSFTRIIIPSCYIKKIIWILIENLYNKRIMKNYYLHNNNFIYIYSYRIQCRNSAESGWKRVSDSSFIDEDGIIDC